MQKKKDAFYTDIMPLLYGLLDKLDCKITIYTQNNLIHVTITNEQQQYQFVDRYLDGIKKHIIRTFAPVNEKYK